MLYEINPFIAWSPYLRLFLFASFRFFPLLRKDEAMTSAGGDFERLIIGHNLSEDRKMMSFPDDSKSTPLTGLLGGVLINVGVSAVSLLPRPSCEVTVGNYQYMNGMSRTDDLDEDHTHHPVPTNKHSRHW